MTPGLFIATGATSLILAVLLGLRAPRVWLALTVLGCAAGLVAAAMVLVGGTAWEWRSTFALGSEQAHLRLDAVSAFFLAPTCFVGAVASVYIRDYWSDKHYPKSARINRLWWNALILTLGAVLLCSNGLHFLIAWEIFAVSSYFLITLERQQRGARAAGWLYLAASHAGTLALFAFFALLATRTGSWELGPMRDRPELAPLFWLAFGGFAVKAGLFPVHIWLPSAHANAPSHVSAIMSGVCIKLGVYGIVRFGGWLPVPDAAGWTIMGIGSVTALLGIAFALGQNDFKRLLAYSSVENVGIIFVGVGGALIGLTHGDARWAKLVMAGALLHVWNHSLFKSLLFFGAGSVLHATGTREMSRLGGLWRVMPWTTALFGIGSIAVCALPPLNGFVSEWLIYLGLFDTVANRTLVAWIAMPAAIMLGITGALALAGFIKASATMFLGAPRTKIAQHAHESGSWMLAPMFVNATACLLLGVAPVLVWPAVATVVGSWNPAWADGLPANTVTTLAPVQLGLAVVLILGIVWLRLRVRRQGVERGPTWDCGYALPTARMQYTGGSFGGIASGWFGWILQPERKARRPRGFFPADAIRIERVPETVLEHGLQPIGRLILTVSNAVRQLQHGRLQYYIAYVVVGLIALTALVTVGVAP